MGLLAPIGLAALGALGLPVMIHFIRRPEEKELDFAALHWIAQRTKPRQSLRLRELFLLTLRLLLIAVLGLILALPYWQAHGRDGSAWVVVVPGVDPITAQAAIAAPGAEWHWLAPGFPAFGSAAPTAIADPFSLIRELDAVLPAATRLSLVVPNTLTGLDAERPALSHSVDWQVLPGTGPVPDASPSGAGGPAESLRLAIRADSAADRERRVVLALVKSWEAGGTGVALDVAGKDTPPAAGTDWLFWLGGELSPAVLDWARRGGTVLASGLPLGDGVPVLMDEAGQAALSEAAIGRGRLFRMATPLTPEAQPLVGEPDFPTRLQAVLASPVTVSDRADAATLAPGKGSGVPTGPMRPMAPALGLLAAVLFLLERLWATRRHRGMP